jgi:hypothetical protein
MSKPYFVWRNDKGKHQCRTNARWYVMESKIVAWLDSYADGVAYARQANIDEADKRREDEKERASAEAKQGELAI